MKSKGRSRWTAARKWWARLKSWCSWNRGKYFILSLNQGKILHHVIETGENTSSCHWNRGQYCHFVIETGDNTLSFCHWNRGQYSVILSLKQGTILCHLSLKQGTILCHFVIETGGNTLLFCHWNRGQYSVIMSLMFFCACVGTTKSCPKLSVKISII